MFLPLFSGRVCVVLVLLLPSVWLPLALAGGSARQHVQRQGAWSASLMGPGAAVALHLWPHRLVPLAAAAPCACAGRGVGLGRGGVSLHTLPALCAGGESLLLGVSSLPLSGLNLGQSCARASGCSFPGDPAPAVWQPNPACICRGLGVWPVLVSVWVLGLSPGGLGPLFSVDQPGPRVEAAHHPSSEGFCLLPEKGPARQVLLATPSL